MLFCRTSLDAYECRHGLGYSRFHGEKNGLAADLLAFVPVDTPCEINKLTLKNNSDAAKEISLFSYTDASGQVHTGWQGFLYYLKPDFKGLTVQRFLQILLPDDEDQRTDPAVDSDGRLPWYTGSDHWFRY